MRERTWAIGCLVSTAIFVLVFAAGTGAARAAAPGSADTKWVKTEIFFGQNLAGGKKIAQGDWQNFMDKELTKRFPKGLTVYDSYGQMQHADGRIERQSTWVVVLVLPEDPASEKSVQEAVDAFRKRFSKAQVMILNTPVSPKFFAD